MEIKEGEEVLFYLLWNLLVHIEPADANQMESKRNQMEIKVILYGTVCMLKTQ